MQKQKGTPALRERTAAEIADAVVSGLENASYTAGAAALVTVLGRWIAERSSRPVADAVVWGGAMETLVEEIARHRNEKGAQGVAA